MALAIATLTQPIIGETACGDCCGWWHEDSRLVLAVVDGLGHGAHAALAAESACECIAEHIHANCEALFEQCNIKLQNTRGAALAIAVIDLFNNQMHIASVGNIRCVLLRQNGSYRLGGARGIVGAGYDSLAPESVTLDSGDLLVMYTDGLDEFADLRSYFDQGHISVSHHAENILKRWRKGEDDAGILVYRHGSPRLTCSINTSR